MLHQREHAENKDGEHKDDLDFGRHRIHPLSITRKWKRRAGIDASRSDGGARARRRWTRFKLRNLRLQRPNEFTGLLGKAKAVNEEADVANEEKQREQVG